MLPAFGVAAAELAAGEFLVFQAVKVFRGVVEEAGKFKIKKIKSLM